MLFCSPVYMVVLFVLFINHAMYVCVCVCMVLYCMLCAGGVVLWLCGTFVTFCSLATNFSSSISRVV